MVFYQEFLLVWSTVELFMSVTHLFVLMGFKNSKLGFLRRQQNYFIFDASCHFVNAIMYSPSTVGYPIYLLWIYAVFVHLYYVRNLIVNPMPPKKEVHENGNNSGNIKAKVEEDNAKNLSKIFHWSCTDSSEEDRFNVVKYGRQIAETIIDVSLHFCGFLFAFQNIQIFWYKVATFVLMSGLLYKQMLTLKYFSTDPKMMPKQIQKFFATKSSVKVATK